MDNFENNLGTLIQEEAAKDNGLICYLHEAEFFFQKKEFFENLGLNPDAFYGIKSVYNGEHGEIILKITVNSEDNNFFIEKS